MRGKNQGFSLIEILVAISIITVLSVISFFAFSAVQKKSRDAKRQSDLGLIRSALEQYRADQGFYPKNTVDGSPQSFLGTVGAPFTNHTGNPVVPLPTLKTYLAKTPADPLNGTTGYNYQYLAKSSTGGTCNNTPASYCRKYSLCANLENETTGTCSQTGSTQNFEVATP